MIDSPELLKIVTNNQTKIIMVVIDGLGGLRDPKTGKSELEAAYLPNLDLLAQDSACGLSIPVSVGVTPGSGPGHLALFGYDPLKYLIGRGALEALGVDGVDFIDGDIVARGNFCTVDKSGILIDRRAKRISSDFASALCERLNTVKIDSVDIAVYPVKEHRFVLRIRGQNLSAELSESDPQKIDVCINEVKPLAANSENTAVIVNEFVRKAHELLAEEETANMILLRGFSGMPSLPSMGEAYKLKPVAIAGYPMYRGLASIMGMQVINTGSTFDNQLDSLKANYNTNDFFFLHYKAADTAGEDGNFLEKIQALEYLDTYISKLRSLEPDVLMIVGDHSTPAIMAGHSWHPVPFALESKWTQSNGVKAFDEYHCSRGTVGTFFAKNIMALALAHAGRLVKFGA
ncbi:2,3-bisphosphoglycerate-independent phosphoglycerate mutase [SAR202 cluster bacterium AC-409-J13_OGT_754m]|nr:2,3-bisphosphoglycerate-independent phosphoglycerate mutase [SAR202 cluster bacterium AC-409-J13_OGT_754m]